MPHDSELVEIRIIGFPVDLYRVTAEHHDALMREFALLAEGGGDHAPARLVALGEEVSARYSGFTTDASSDIAAAVERGDEQIDLVYHLPRNVGEASQRLMDLLDEADEYCRREQLLTLATPPDARAFRAWFLREFIVQSAGGEATPWPGVEAARNA